MSCPVRVTATFQKQAYGVEVTFSLQRNLTKQKRLEASLYQGLRHMREVIYKALAVKDPRLGEADRSRKALILKK